MRTTWLPIRRTHYSRQIPRIHNRTLLTLAIETSCDDTSVAVLENQQNLAALVQAALVHLPIQRSAVAHPGNALLVDCELRKKPDFVTVTRGPGMRANLNTGLDTAKGLAVAWQVPLLGVNHMQAHAL